MSEPGPYERARPLSGLARRVTAPYWIGAIAGIVTFFASFGLDFLVGRPAYYMAPHGDPGWHIAAVAAYLREPWGWPLFHVVSIYDEAGGSNLTLLDGIPCLAVVLKAIVTVVPAWRDFLALHCLAIWLLLALTLQGVLAVRLARALGQVDRLSALAFAVVAVTFPALHWRWQHTALTGHFEILWALSLYFLGPDRLSRSRFLLEVFALAVLSALTHPYLFGMIAPILAVAASRRRLLLVGSAAVIAAALLAYGATGTLSEIGTARSRGYGHNGANLATFVLSQRSGLVPTPPSWSEAPAMQQYEGYAYLGVGVLVALVVATARTGRRLLALLRRHWLLCVVLAAMAVFAIANRVYVGSHNLYSLETLPGWFEPIAGTFRASGRFIWPLAYVIVAFAMVGILRGPSRLLVGALLVLQVADATGDMRLHHERVHRPVPAEDWLDHRLLAGFERLHMEPPPICHVSAAEPEIMQHITLLAATHGLATSSSVVPRSLTPCAHSDTWDRTDTIYYATRQATALLMERGGLTCTRMGRGYACSVAPRQWPPSGVAPLELVDGELLKLRRESIRSRVLDSHWVSWWSAGTSARLVFAPPPAARSTGYWLTFCGGAALGGNRPASVVHVDVNGTRGGILAFASSNNAPTTGKSLYVPAPGGSPVATVALTVLDARPPRDVGLGDEDKPVGVELWAFGVSTTAPLDCTDALDSVSEP